MAKKIYSTEERQAQAVKIGLKLGKSVGLARVSVGKVAAEMKVTAPLLFHAFGSREGFHKAVAKAAKAAGITFPESTPTVRAARAIRAAEREKAAKKAAPKVVAPKTAAKKAAPKAPKVVAPKPKAAAPKVVAPKTAAKKVVAPKPKAAAPKVVAPKPKASGKIKVPELAKFPAMPVPSTAAA